VGQFPSVGWVNLRAARPRQAGVRPFVGRWQPGAARPRHCRRKPCAEGHHLVPGDLVRRKAEDLFLVRSFRLQSPTVQVVEGHVLGTSHGHDANAKGLGHGYFHVPPAAIFSPARASDPTPSRRKFPPQRYAAIDRRLDPRKELFGLGWRRDVVIKTGAEALGFLGMAGSAACDLLNSCRLRARVQARSGVQESGRVPPRADRAGGVADGGSGEGWSASAPGAARVLGCAAGRRRWPGGVPGGRGDPRPRGPGRAAHLPAPRRRPAAAGAAPLAAAEGCGRFWILRAGGARAPRTAEA
jgi:hypothetical protein